MRRSKPLALRAALVGGMCSGVLAAMVLVCLALPASPSAATIATTTSADALSDYGSSTVHVPFSQVYTFSVVCSELPCRITLTESARRRRTAHRWLGHSHWSASHHECTAVCWAGTTLY